MQAIEDALSADRRVLLFGQAGIGKSTLARSLAHTLHDGGRSCWCIGADPGSPGFGIPGAVCLGKWDGEDWVLADYEALCTLDAGRFRLPLTIAVTRLTRRLSGGTLLVDMPGVVRSVAGAELLAALKQAADIDLVLALVRKHRALPLAGELQALRIDVLRVDAAAAASRPGRRQRARRRTGLWDDWLDQAQEQTIDLDQVRLTGTPPPEDRAAAWAGRQIALLAGEHTLGMGEVRSLAGRILHIRSTVRDGRVDTLLVRDALRNTRGVLTTARPFASGTFSCLPPDVSPYQADRGPGGPRPVAHIRIADAVLVNGVSGDPLLHLRLRQQRRSLLFDLGMPGRLSARIAHQVSDVFISHAHVDHIGGFLWLLRSRIGDFPVCRLYGPPGLADNIEGLIHGVHWDRIGDQGPRFDVSELHGNRLIRYRLQAGREPPVCLGEKEAMNGKMLDEPGFVVRAVTLDHGTPVLAFAFEPAVAIGIRKESLAARGWQPGPWLGPFKRQLLSADRNTVIVLPDGTHRRADRLAEEFIRERAGRKLVYATDLADTPENRNRLIQLAKGCHTFFCEAAFAETDTHHAQRTGHLTTRACGEIALAADVHQLVPFHFSRRYGGQIGTLYREIAAVCARVVIPKPRQDRKYETD